jgi:hypothetical protein
LIVTAWLCCYILGTYLTGEVLAVDTGTVGLVASVLSFIGSIVVALLNGRRQHAAREPAPDAGALIAALADVQQRLEEAEDERARLQAELASEREAHQRLLRALAEARGLNDSGSDGAQEKRRK